MDFFKNIIKKFFRKKGQNSFCSISTTKHSMSSAYTLKFSTETEKKKQEINNYLKDFLKKYMNSPEKLLQYMQANGMTIYKMKNASKVLEKIGEDEGFLTPLKGFKAIIINLIIGILFEEKFKIAFTTKDMFIFNDGETEIYTIARALHKYYGYKKKLPGYDYKSQEIFKRVYSRAHNKQTSPFAGCSTIKDMYACKEAIARDIESINFSVELSLEHERAKKALNILQETKSANI